MPALNERFCESGGVCPPKHLCEFASSPPAQAFVIPPPSQSRFYVKRKQCGFAGRQRGGGHQVSKS
jgi:hypothetical protein